MIRKKKIRELITEKTDKLFLVYEEQKREKRENHLKELEKSEIETKAQIRLLNFLLIS